MRSERNGFFNHQQFINMERKYLLKTSLYEKKVDIDQAGDYLIQARDQRMKDDQIVEDNREKDRPLHRIFTWNDRIAARKQRRQELRKFERSLIIVTEDPSLPKELQEKPAIVRIPRNTVEDTKSSTLISVPLQEAEHSPSAMKYVTEQYKKELNQILAQYRKFEVLQEYNSMLQDLIEMI